MNSHEPLWARMSLREARNPNLECCGESLKCFYLSSLPLSVYPTHCSFFLLTCCLYISRVTAEKGQPQLHGRTNLSVSVFSVSLTSNPNNRVKIPIGPSRPINREWSQSVGSRFTRQQPASCPWGSLGQYELGRRSVRSPLQEADFCRLLQKILSTALSVGTRKDSRQGTWRQVT